MLKVPPGYMSCKYVGCFPYLRRCMPQAYPVARAEAAIPATQLLSNVWPELLAGASVSESLGFCKAVDQDYNDEGSKISCGLSDSEIFGRPAKGSIEDFGSNGRWSRGVAVLVLTDSKFCRWYLLPNEIGADVLPIATSSPAENSAWHFKGRLQPRIEMPVALHLPLKGVTDREARIRCINWSFLGTRMLLESLGTRVPLED